MADLLADSLSAEHLAQTLGWMSDPTGGLGHSTLWTVFFTCMSMSIISCLSHGWLMGEEDW